MLLEIVLSPDKEAVPTEQRQTDRELPDRQTNSDRHTCQENNNILYVPFNIPFNIPSTYIPFNIPSLKQLINLKHPYTHLYKNIKKT